MKYLKSKLISLRHLVLYRFMAQHAPNTGFRPVRNAKRHGLETMHNKFFGLFLGRFGSLNGLVGLVQACNNIVGDVESLICI